MLFGRGRDTLRVTGASHRARHGCDQQRRQNCILTDAVPAVQPAAAVPPADDTPPERSGDRQPFPESHAGCGRPPSLVECALPRR